MMDQQNLGTMRPVSADPTAIALAKALGQWPKPAGSGRPSPKKVFDAAPAATVEALAKELGLRLGDQNELTI
ncbi:MAG: DNA topoisomerase IB, partial [Xanthobacteraceae bacterium]